ncbi:DNA-cytosine methyltransferase [Halothece sp. PCC 7418]|uniref:DNA (cytosine-5-)-methyltransferase n=1 Tax=Halothece sp. (strain PCC 7418) TaxID=65093 RepID=UPI0002A05C66|nr:DNA (cytosine-5-)-methyltransferase [Halothece sp. PCC 7418]AFZ45286.1 DNA-cytosine methyltransferase [Halothece sp. PCC 7418]
MLQTAYIPELLESINPAYDTIKSPYTVKRKIKFIDLFAGIGGMRLAFKNSNSECVFSCEWDSHAQKTYRANFNEIPFGDINKIQPDAIPDHEILLAGFPCQPFSAIGKREGFLHKTQGTLFYSIAKILAAKRTLCFLLENVPGLLTNDNGKTFQIILKTLDELNYDVRYATLDAADFGLPQYRKRIYIVGFNREYLEKRIDFDFPQGNNNTIFINQFLESNLTGYSISKHLQQTYLFKKDDGKPQIVDNSSQIKVKTLVSTYHKIQRLTGTFVRDGETGIRLLSEGECKAIMGFPDEFIIPVSRTQMYRQLGNSVAIPVIRAIAKKIYNNLEAVIQQI